MSKRFSSGIGRVLVTTTSRIGAFFSRSTAGPESRPWVAASTPREAPRSISRLAAQTTVPAVSIMSSTRTQTSAVDVADDLGGDGDVVRALGPALVDEGEVGLDAGVARQLAKRRASLPPPASGDTTTTSPSTSLGQVVGEQRHRGEVVDREVEEALDLTGVQVDGDDAVGAGDGEQVGERAAR